jgi:CBS domain-containing protein
MNSSVVIDVPVSAVMTESTPSVSPTATAAEVAGHLRRSDVPAVVVRDDGGDVVGMVTDSDVVAVVAEGGGNPPVSSFMSAPVVTVAPSTPVGLAADRMRDAGVARLPVVDDDARYRGVVVRDDVAPYLSRHRLEIDWDDEPLSLDGSGGPGTTAE